MEGRATGVHDLSSILKALKKVEQEESRDENGTSSWPDSVRSARQSVKQESRKKIVVFSMVTVFSVFGIVMIYLGRSTNFFSTPDKTHDIGSGIKPGADIEKRAPEPDPRFPTTTPGTEKKLQAKMPKKPRGASAKAGPVLEKTNSPAYVKDDDLPGGNARNPAPDARDNQRTASFPEIKHDSRIDIQAIAWAEEPDRRFAVINNSIIREGGRVDGITVVSIEDGMVFFSENGNEWRQQFVVR